MIIAAATLVITLVILPQLSSLEEAFRQALFTVSSIMTTTGFSISDFDQWPNLAKLILLLLMLGCAGSTAGGLKVSRITMLWETFKSNLKRIIHPHQVAIVTMDHKRIEESWLLSVKNYFITYMFLYVLILILVAPSSPDLETTISAVTTTYNNVGPGFKAVGPMSSFADMSTWNKLVLSFAMLFGRLEIYPLLLLFTHNTWKRV